MYLSASFLDKPSSTLVLLSNTRSCRLNVGTLALRSCLSFAFPLQFSCFQQLFLETVLVCSVIPGSTALRFARGRALELTLYQLANSFLCQIAIEMGVNYVDSVQGVERNAIITLGSKDGRFD